MRKRAIPVFIAIVLILIIGGISYFTKKYSYSDERVDLDEYFGVKGDELAIILQDELLEEKALLREGRCYFELDAVERYFDKAFYVDRTEGLVLYTSPLEIYQTKIGGTVLESSGTSQELGYAAAIMENDTVYLAADFVKRFVNLSVELFDRHVQVYDQWGEKLVDTAAKATSVRLQGGIKSPILEDLEEGEEVEILERMEEWSRVKTADSIIGYVENKHLTLLSSGEPQRVPETPVTDCPVREYTSLAMDGKLCLGFHAIGTEAGNSTLGDMAAGASGINVIAPTWFSLNDENGGFRSFASQDYVNQAHGLGLQVWGVWDDFNYNNETKAGLDVLAVLSATSTRQALAEQIVRTALELGLDGVNIDFEKLTEERGEEFAQFIRELSVGCRRNQLFLSVDNYVPYKYRDYYALDVQGEAADYVIIMGYDEHWSGSGDPGSVASIDYVTNGINLGLEKVPAGKLVNALPFYSIVWKITGSSVTDEYLTLKNVDGYLGTHGASAVWDEETSQNYAEWEEKGSTYRVWLEDEDSIAVKLSVMEAHDLGGAAVWRLGYGNEAVWELIRNYLSQS